MTLFDKSRYMWWQEINFSFIFIRCSPFMGISGKVGGGGYVLVEAKYTCAWEGWWICVQLENLGLESLNPSGKDGLQGLDLDYLALKLTWAGAGIIDLGCCVARHVGILMP
jgi:hypothetical protein